MGSGPSAAATVPSQLPVQFTFLPQALPVSRNLITRSAIQNTTVPGNSRSHCHFKCLYEMEDFCNTK